ncbi:MAG: glycosyltransferase family 4 protein [Janthinobacterium lividum]
MAEKDYDIAHTYISNIKTPHGNMDDMADQSENLKIIPIYLKEEFKKYSFIGRYKGEVEFSKKLGAIIKSFKPDIVISANTPLLAQSRIQKQCAKNSIKFIYWCQDIHSIAIESYFKKRRLFFGGFLISYFRNREIRLLKNSDHVIAISEEFNTTFKAWGIAASAISVIHNWGPLNEIAVKPKLNLWSRKMGIESKIVILYSGTLGLKHNPALIVQAATRYKENAAVIFVVISEGTGAEYLKEQISIHKLNNLIILPYQDYNHLSSVLSSADILLSILEKDAALFSVPSKVLTYLCAAKPLLLSVPSTNLSAKIVIQAEAGLCSEPENFEDFFIKLSSLISDKNLRIQLGINGRKYAEDHFQIPVIANQFLKIIDEISN